MERVEGRQPGRVAMAKLVACRRKDLLPSVPFEARSEEPFEVASSVVHADSAWGLRGQQHAKVSSQGRIDRPSVAHMVRDRISPHHAN